MSSEEVIKENLTRWSTKPLIEDNGVIVGCSSNQEWLLPWWWMNLQMQNNKLPITFFDFGNMTSVAKQWCEKRGQLQTLSNEVIESFIALKSDVISEQINTWENHKNLDVWKARLAWFKKPFACIQSPYSKTIWIDLDCQVRKSLTPLFSFSENQYGMSMAQEPEYIMKHHRDTGELLEGEIEYNSGVISFKHGSSLIQAWAKNCLESNENLRGDQEVFSRFIFENKIIIPSLPPKFNQRAIFTEDLKEIYPKDDSIAVWHWCGGQKLYIHAKIEFLKSQSFINFSLDSD
jgi:lipopolysaccharide biosynthesis glycosyltransferase